MDTVRAQIPAHVTVFSAEVQQIIPIEWEYTRSDPYAVHLLAPGEYADTPIRWVFARSILTDALREDNDNPLSGEGDVTASADANDVVVYLTSPEGTAALIFERERMESFLNASYGVVPAQSADDTLSGDLDEFLADVLGYAPAETVDTRKLPGETKELHFPMSGMTYTVPADSPKDLAEWEAELLHDIYSEEKRDDNDNEDPENIITEE